MPLPAIRKQPETTPPHRDGARQAKIHFAAEDIRIARQWFLLAIGSLLVAGLFALLLVVGRTPPFNAFISDPEFFKRCLVMHVNLSLLVWFSAFIAGMFWLLPKPKHQRTGVAHAGFPIALGGVAAMCVAAFLPGSIPILSNYIPFIDHPVFIIGLIAFLGGLAITYSQKRLWPVSHENDAGTLPREVAHGVRFAAIATLAAIVTFLAAWIATPGYLPSEAYFELVAWGGGHVLQVANVAGMLAVWLLLARFIIKRPVLSAPAAAILFALLVAPHLVSPLLTIEGTATALYHRGATQLMRWGIFPVVSIFLVIMAWRIVTEHRCGRLDRGWWKSLYFIGLSSSAIMTVTGFILGAMIRSSTTMVPAHYHASIGAVTVAFMAMAYLLLNPLGFRLRSVRLRRLIPWQLTAFASGQLIFALGFAIGGAYGLDRKAYGSEQHMTSLGEYAGIAVMGIGGLLAVAGGVMFLVLMLAARPTPYVTQFSVHKKLEHPA